MRDDSRGGSTEPATAVRGGDQERYSFWDIWTESIWQEYSCVLRQVLDQKPWLVDSSLRSVAYFEAASYSSSLCPGHQMPHLGAELPVSPGISCSRGRRRSCRFKSKCTTTTTYLPQPPGKKVMGTIPTLKNNPTRHC